MKNLASGENNFGVIYELYFSKFGTNAEIDRVLHMLIRKCQRNPLYNQIGRKLRPIPPCMKTQDTPVSLSATSHSCQPVSKFMEIPEVSNNDSRLH